MAYESVHLENSIAIENIISVHYFQYMSDFSFPGESHDFWELVCVDRGEIIAVAGDRQLALKKGNILFHKPNEFHNVLTNGRISPSLVVIGFDCHSPCMKAFEDQLMNVQDTEKELLAKINEIGLGPAGLGGDTTALAVNINTYATHIAGLPVAVNICCHVNRHMVRTI